MAVDLRGFYLKARVFIIPAIIVRAIASSCQHLRTRQPCQDSFTNNLQSVIF